MSSATTVHPAFPGGKMPASIIVLLGLISAIGPLSTDMYLPAFPTLDRELGGGPGSSQFTLATWFAGLSVGQFTCGPLSDRFGRRAPLIIGMLIYTLASAGCALTSDYRLFCVFRFMAAIGGAVGVVSPRAIVRDVSTGHQGVIIMTQLTLVFGVAPVLAPSLGGAVLLFGSWRWIFWFATIYGVLASLAIYLMLPDTLPLARRIRLNASSVITRYLFVLREPNFRYAALTASFGTFITFAYLGGAPTVFEHLVGLTPSQFAIFFGVNASVYIASFQINGRLARRVPITLLMERGVMASIASALLFLLLAVTHVASPAHPVIVALCIMTVTGSLGFIGANATVLAFHHHSAHAGSASAMLGTMQFAIGSVSGLMMGFMPVDSVIPTAATMAFGAVMAVVFAIQRHRIAQ